MEQAQAAQTASAEALRDLSSNHNHAIATQQAQQQLHDKKLALQQVHGEQQQPSKLLHLQQREQELQSRLQQTQASLNSCEEPLEAAQEQVEVLLMQQLEAQTKTQLL